MSNAWPVLKLRNLALIDYGHTAKATYSPAGPRFLRITDIQNDSVNWETVPYCLIDPGRAARMALRSGDIVFARTGATTGKSFLVQSPPDAIFASYLIRLRLTERRLLPTFLSYYFQTSQYWSTIRNGISGSAQGGFNASKLGEIAVPVPPVSEQKRLIRVLDEACASITLSEHNTRQNITNARKLYQSDLDARFAQLRRNVGVERIRDICILENGDRGHNYPSRSKRTSHGVPFINAGHLVDGAIDTDHLDYISKSHFARLSNGKIAPQDVLFCLRGSLGKTARVGPLGEGAIASSLVIVRPAKRLNDKFLLAYFESCLSAEMIATYRNGAAQPNLSAKSLGLFEIPVPSKADQAQLVRRLAELRSCVQDLAALYRFRLNALENLKQSLLSAAFSGAL